MLLGPKFKASSHLYRIWLLSLEKTPTRKASSRPKSRLSRRRSSSLSLSNQNRWTASCPTVSSTYFPWKRKENFSRKCIGSWRKAVGLSLTMWASTYVQVLLSLHGIHVTYIGHREKTFARLYQGESHCLCSLPCRCSHRKWLQDIPCWRLFLRWVSHFWSGIGFKSFHRHKHRW